MRYRVENEKIKFVSTSGHVIFCLLYKRTNDDVFDDFPKISEYFPKISEDSSKVVRRPDERFRRKISEEELIMFRSYNKSKGLCNHSNGKIFSYENRMLFSRVKICLRAKAHLVFHWCLYNKISISNTLERHCITSIYNIDRSVLLENTSQLSGPSITEAGAFTALCSMKRLGVFLRSIFTPPGWDASPPQGTLPPALSLPVPIYTPGWREEL